MSITFPLSMPAAPSPRNVTLGANNIVSLAVSPFTGSSQIQEWQGEWWEAEIALPSMLRTVAEPWIAFLTALRGQSGSFLMGDPARKTPYGIATGTPLCNGIQAGGSKTLVTDGWTANKTGILKAGDYLQIGTGTTQRLYKNLTDANSDSGGNATLDIFPRLRPEGVTDNEAIVTASPKGVFRLAGNWRQWQQDFTRAVTISFKAVENL
jgi:hypothetical protein